MKKLPVFVFLTVISFSAVQGQTGLPPAAERAMNAIDAERIRATVKDLSDDALEGRGTGPTGGDKAADLMAAQFKKSGLVPAGSHGTDFQKRSVSGVLTATTETTV